MRMCMAPNAFDAQHLNVRYARPHITAAAWAERTKHAADLVTVQLLHLHIRIGGVAA